MAINDITGDALVSRVPSEAYKNNYDRIFGNKDRKKEAEKPDAVEAEKDCDGSQHATG